LTTDPLKPQSKPSSKILYGDNELIFSKLPASVLGNFERPRSENALLWNTIYPLAQPSLSLRKLLGIPPLWGTVELELGEDQLIPYFWGYNVLGEKFSPLDHILRKIDGKGPFTEVDLFLRGEHILIAVEAKHFGGLGRCARFGCERCPEVHENGENDPCRYWEVGEQKFQNLIDFGDRPTLEDPSPPCNQHYQLARTMLVGHALAKELRLNFGLWLLVTRTRWRSSEKDWLDFVKRIRDDELWRRMRVIAWEDLRQLSFI